VTPVPSLSRSAADRVAERRNDDGWLASAWQDGKLLVVDENSQAAVIDDGPHLVFVESGSCEGDGDRFLLGVGGDGTAYWGTIGALPRRLGSRPLGLREVGATLDDLESGLFVATIALANWHATHPRCPRCGSLTRLAQAGWSRHCDVDDTQHFPRTDPAVIVLLHDGGDNALLGRQPTWPPGRYSTIAGFVESGESAEHAVVREVREETGVEIDDVVYRGSQPWPFPQSLMLGYEAKVVGGEVDNVDKELEDVRWFSRHELRTGNALLPPSASIAHWLITTWLERPVEP
jgi:NAD+ diphosphatase